MCSVQFGSQDFEYLKNKNHTGSHNIRLVHKDESTTWPLMTPPHSTPVRSWGKVTLTGYGRSLPFWPNRLLESPVCRWSITQVNVRQSATTGRRHKGREAMLCGCPLYPAVRPGSGDKNSTTVVREQFWCIDWSSLITHAFNGKLCVSR